MIKAVTVSTEKKQRKRAPDNTGRKQGEPASAKAAVPTHPKAEPTERDRREASDAKARILSRRKRVQVKATGDGTEMKLDASHADHAGWSTQLKDAFGTTSLRLHGAVCVAPGYGNAAVWAGQRRGDQCGAGCRGWRSS